MLTPSKLIRRKFVDLHHGIPEGGSESVAGLGCGISGLLGVCICNVGARLRGGHYAMGINQATRAVLAAERGAEPARAELVRRGEGTQLRLQAHPAVAAVQQPAVLRDDQQQPAVLRRGGRQRRALRLVHAQLPQLRAQVLWGRVCGSPLRPQQLWAMRQPVPAPRQVPERHVRLQWQLTKRCR